MTAILDLRINPMPDISIMYSIRLDGLLSQRVQSWRVREYNWMLMGLLASDRIAETSILMAPPLLALGSSSVLSFILLEALISL